MNTPLITTPGAYPDIAAEDYHGREICPAPSIGSSGLKLLLTRSPRHYWWQSALNPDRPQEEDKRHFRVGRAAHDVLLLSDRWPDFYHVTPEGFSRAKSKQMAVEIAEADAAIDEGRTVISFEDAIMVNAMADSLRANEFAAAALVNGQPEVTLAWQDKETGVWLRARPDFLPTKRLIIPDLKTAADGCPKAFSRAVAANGYAQSAALYLEGIKEVFGDDPSHWLHVVIEKAEPYVVSLYELPAEDIGRGRYLNRRAIRKFADCLSQDRWPGYADDVIQLGMPTWDRRVIDEGITPQGEAWGLAAE